MRKFFSPFCLHLGALCGGCCLFRNLILVDVDWFYSQLKNVGSWWFLNYFCFDIEVEYHAFSMVIFHLCLDKFDFVFGELK